VARYRLPDGTVHPRDLAAPHAAAPLADRGHGHGAGDHGEAHAGGMRPGAASDPAATPHAADHAGAADTADQDTGQRPREVLIAAGKWYYRPHALRLDAGRPYRLRMMAVDVSHGASIQLGRGGRMVRLRPGRLTEMDVAFHAPGRYLVYCTVYCGPAHDLMQATIEVV
jgi:cytochrome c oxidase subunit II